VKRLKLMKMEVGYNLVERKLLGKEFEEIEERMSIVEFLRRLLRGKDVGDKVSAVGLDELLSLNERVVSYIRDLLVRSTGLLWGRIIQFPIDGSLVLNREPKIRYRGKEIRLTPIFGNRLIPKASGYFHSPFNI
jgi:hypothetical protein